MAKPSLTVMESQLLAAKARTLLGLVDGSSFETTTRLISLRTTLTALKGSGESELFRYFPVAAVAVLETHFKATVQAVVDSGSPYLERGLFLVKDRLKSVSEFFPILHRSTVTVGELVAHQLPFNSVASLEDALGKLLEANFKTLIGAAVDPYVVRSELEERGTIVENVNDLWRDLAETFERRHVLAHEAASNYVVTYDHADLAIECATKFTSALDAVLWATVWVDLPLTQYEMNDDANRRYRESRISLARTLREALRVSKALGNRGSFRTLHRNWREYSKGWAQWEADVFAMNSMRPLIEATTHSRLLKARENDVHDWISSARPVGAK